MEFDKLKNLYLSKKWTEEEEKAFNDLLEQGGARHLAEGLGIKQIALTSFQRSGNSLSRKYFEDITGIITGSIVDIRHIRTFALTLCGFKGEGYFNDNVWIFKSHVPIVFGEQTPQPISKAVICVRNPFDVLCSQMQFRLTNTHSHSTKNNIAAEFPEFWAEAVKQLTGMFNNFLDYWT